MRITALITFVLFAVTAYGQTDSSVAGAGAKKIIVVPYAPMMYFSDADAHMARFSQTDEAKVRNQLRVMLEKNIHHQLLSAFNAVSLMNATSLNAEEDLKKIYAATAYSERHADTKNKNAFSSRLFRKKDKKQSFYVSDSSVMLGEIKDPNLNAALHKKYQHDYILYITQMEINTSNKNTIEWQKQQYTRSYMIHYNLWDNQGKLVLAETLTLDGNGENDLKTINEKYLLLMGQKLKEILSASVK